MQTLVGSWPGHRLRSKSRWTPEHDGVFPRWICGERIESGGIPLRRWPENGGALIGASARLLPTVALATGWEKLLLHSAELPQQNATAAYPRESTRTRNPYAASGARRRQKVGRADFGSSGYHRYCDVLADSCQTGPRQPASQPDRNIATNCPLSSHNQPDKIAACA